jgi:hypothetical protein
MKANRAEALCGERQIHGFERIVSTPSRCPGDEDAFGGPRPASVPEFAHVELLPKQLIKQQGNKTRVNNPYGRPSGVRNRATVASHAPTIFFW